MSFDEQLGPINYVVVVFDSAPLPTGGLDRVLGLVEAQRIVVLDIALVAEALVPGGVGVVVFYEDLTLLPALEAWVAEGATVVSEGPSSSTT